MKRRYKLMLTIVGFFALLILGGRFYLNYKANNLLRYLVKEITNNTYKASAESIVIDYFPAGITLQNINFSPVEEKGNYFKGTAKLASLHINSLLGLVAYKRLNVIELEILDPVIESYGKPEHPKQKVGLSTTLRQINHGLLSTFKELKVQNALIKNGTIRVETGEDAEDYILVNHITIGMKDIHTVDEKKKTASGLAAEGKIMLTVANPDVHMPDSAVKVKLGLLHYTTEANTLTLDEASVAYDKPGERQDSFKLSSIKISGFEWLRYINEGMLAFDTVLVDNGTANLNLTNISLFGKNNKGNAKSKKGYNGEDIQINYLNISNIAYTILTTESIEQRKGVAIFTLVGNNLGAKKLSLIGDRSPVVDVETVNINISEYEDYNPADQFTASLEALSISNKNLVIKGYKIVPLKGSDRSRNNLISVPELLLVNYDLDDLLQKRLTAERLVINNPTVVLDVLKRTKQKKNTNTDPNAVISKITRQLSDKITISEIDINNGALRLQPQGLPTDEIVLQGLSLELDADKLLDANRVSQVLNSIKVLKSKGFTIGGQKLNLKVADLQLIENGSGLFFGRVKGNIGPDVELDLFGVSVVDRNLTLTVTETDKIELSDIRVDSGFVTINASMPTAANKIREAKETVELIANNLDLKNVVFRYRNANGLAASTQLSIQSENFHFKNRNATWDKLQISSRANQIKTDALQFDAGQMEILQPGFARFTNAKGGWKKQQTSLNFSAPAMDIQVGISSTNINQLELKAIEMTAPDIEIRVGKKLAQNIQTGEFSKPLPALSLKKLTLHRPTITLHSYDARQQETVTTKTSSADIALSNFSTQYIDSTNWIMAEGFAFNSTTLTTSFGSRRIQDAIAQINLSNIAYNTATKQFSFITNNALLKNIDQSFTLKDSSQLHVRAETIGIKDVAYDSKNNIILEQLLKDKSWWSEGLYINYAGNQILDMYNLNVNHNKNIDFSFDSLQMRPKYGRDSFWASQPFETDYMPLKLGRTSARNVSYLYTDSTLKQMQIPYLSVDSLFLHPQRDKRFPDDTVAYRPLLAAQLKAIPFNIALDTLALTNSNVQYNEINDKGRESMLFFTDINGTITNARNYNASVHDSLRILINAKAMGTGNLRLHFRQSYTDSLQHFMMGARLGSFELKQMNSIAEGLGVRIKGGRIDSLTMLAKGNNIFAYGKMDVRYNGLKLKLLGKDGKERFFLSGVVDWLANLILRGKDNGKADLLFKERMQEKGTFNFWGKIFAEGILTNFGIKRNKKERKRFLRSLEQHDIPNVGWDF